MLKGVILNEVDVVNEFLKKATFPEGVKKTDILRLLMRNYYNDSKEKTDDGIIITIDKEKMFEKLLQDLKKVLGDNFVYTKWDKTLKTMIGNFYKNISIHGDNIQLVNIKEVIISPIEIEYIRELKNEKLERIAFVLLIYAKVFNLMNDKNDSWVRVSPTIICQEAGAKLRGIEQYKKLHELYEKKYISMSNMNFKTGIKVNYCDSGIEEGISITNFDKVVNEYVLLTKDKVKYCIVCGDVIEITSNRKVYCDTCSKNERRRYKTEKQRKYRNVDI